MKFKTWIEADMGLANASPDMMAAITPNKGSDTVASNQVKKTGLQPQVDAHEIQTKQKDEQDKLMAIDAEIQRMDKEIPQGKADSSKLSDLQSLWEKFKSKWEDIKNQDGLGEPEDMDDPNAIPEPKQFPSGMGAVGMS